MAKSSIDIDIVVRDKIMKILLDSIQNDLLGTNMATATGKATKATLNGQPISVDDMKWDVKPEEPEPVKPSPVKLSAYDLLGLSPTCASDDIQSAFRRLAKQWHPDLNKTDGAAEMFSDIQQAYKLLSDPKRRKKYDAIRKLEEEGVSKKPSSATVGGWGTFTSAQMSNMAGSATVWVHLAPQPTQSYPRWYRGHNPQYDKNVNLIMSSITKSRGAVIGGVHILNMTRGYDAGEIEIEGVYATTPGDELVIGGIPIGIVRSHTISSKYSTLAVTSISFDI